MTAIVKTLWIAAFALAGVWWAHGEMQPYLDRIEAEMRMGLTTKH